MTTFIFFSISLVIKGIIFTIKHFDKIMIFTVTTLFLIFLTGVEILGFLAGSISLFLYFSLSKALAEKSKLAFLFVLTSFGILTGYAFAIFWSSINNEPFSFSIMILYIVIFVISKSIQYLDFSDNYDYEDEEINYQAEDEIYDFTSDLINENERLRIKLMHAKVALQQEKKKNLKVDEDGEKNEKIN